MNFNTPLTTPSTSYGVVPFQRQFVSAQRRYDNMRVRENDMQHRLCRECGRIVHGDDLSFQHHVVSHEAAFICYQIYHFEKKTALSKNYYGHQKAKYTKDKSVASGSLLKKSARDFVRKQMKLTEPRKRKNDGPPNARGRPPKYPRIAPKVKDAQFINDKKVIKSELNLSEEESEVSNLTESDLDDVILPVDEDYGEKNYGEQDPEDTDYVPVHSTSSRGRPRKPTTHMD